MIRSILISLITSLLLTLIFESAAAFVIGFRTKKDFLLLFLVNLVTNPVVGITLDCIFYFRPTLLRWYTILLLELAATAAEALLYRRRLDCKKLSPLLISILCNAVSYTGGLLYDKIF